MAENTRKDYYLEFMFGTVITSFVVLFYYMAGTRLLPKTTVVMFLFEVLGDVIPLIKHVTWVPLLCLALMIWNSNYLLNEKKAVRGENRNKKKTGIVVLSTLIFGAIFSFGPIIHSPNSLEELYNIVIYPIIAILAYVSTYFFAIYVPLFDVENSETKTKWKLPSENRDEFSIKLETDKGDMYIPNPFQGIFITGGAGAGKSYSIITPIIYQSITKGYSAIIYDFKGDPPTLGNDTYKIWDKQRQAHSMRNMPKFKIINLSNPSLSNRVNPISPKYKDGDLFCNEIALSMMKNLDDSLREKSGDFWSMSATTVLEASLDFFTTHLPSMATIPHVISFILSNGTNIMAILSLDEKIKKKMQSVLSGRSAEQQLAGVLASVQNPLKKLYNREVFYCFSKDEINLNINAVEDPTILVCCSDPSRNESYNPALATVFMIVLKNANQKNKLPCLVSIDEAPQIFINNLDQIPATARSNKVITMVAGQSYPQFERMYGKENARVLMANIGNQFFGMEKDPERAKQIADSMGTVEKDKESITYGDNFSTSMSQQKENRIESAEIAGLELGTFVGSLAGLSNNGGQPPVFKAKFKGIDEKKAFSSNEIPTTYISRLFKYEEVLSSINKMAQTYYNMVEGTNGGLDFSTFAEAIRDQIGDKNLHQFVCNLDEISQELRNCKDLTLQNNPYATSQDIELFMKNYGFLAVDLLEDLVFNFLAKAYKLELDRWFRMNNSAPNLDTIKQNYHKHIKKEFYYGFWTKLLSHEMTPIMEDNRKAIDADIASIFKKYDQSLRGFLSASQASEDEPEPQISEQELSKTKLKLMGDGEGIAQLNTRLLQMIKVEAIRKKV